MIRKTQISSKLRRRRGRRLPEEKVSIKLDERRCRTKNHLIAYDNFGQRYAPLSALDKGITVKG